MKSIKNSLSILAFIFAFGTAFTTSANVSNPSTIIWAKLSAIGPCTKIQECSQVVAPLLCGVQVYNDDFFSNSNCVGLTVVAYVRA